MTKKHLTIFVEVCRCLSFSQAAQALNTTQPAVSLAIKELESHYGVELFERMNRRVYLTEAGQTLLACAQEILGGFREAEELLGQGRAPSRLRVGANVSFGASRLPQVLAAFRQRQPQVELSAQVANSDEIESALLENHLDVAVVDNLGFSSRLRTFPLWGEDMALLCAPDFPHRPRTLEELAQVPLLLREPGSGTRRSVERVLGEQGLSPSPFLESVSTAALLGAAKAGLGMTVLSPALVCRELDEGSLLAWEIPGVRFFRQYFCALHRQKASSPALEEFLSLLREGTP